MVSSSSLVVLALASGTTNAFVPSVPSSSTCHQVGVTQKSSVAFVKAQESCTTLFAEESSGESTATEEVASVAEVADVDPLAKAESLGRGAAKAKRGKRKGTSDTKKSSPTPKTTLAAEETFYEGPPAITETIAPTISILTVVGIIPAAAAWARQAWVRYRITSRRIRVTSGIGGKDMAEIVYPDIVEIRTVKRLFGDGDMVVFLRDGAKFEMRNIPKFEEAMEFMLKYCDDDVVAEYKKTGDVSKP